MNKPYKPNTEFYVSKDSEYGGLNLVVEYTAVARDTGVRFSQIALNFNGPERGTK